MLCLADLVASLLGGAEAVVEVLDLLFLISQPFVLAFNNQFEFTRLLINHGLYLLSKWVFWSHFDLFRALRRNDGFYHEVVRVQHCWGCVSDVWPHNRNETLKPFFHAIHNFFGFLEDLVIVLWFVCVLNNSFRFVDIPMMRPFLFTISIIMSITRGKTLYAMKAIVYVRFEGFFPLNLRIFLHYQIHDSYSNSISNLFLILLICSPFKIKAVNTWDLADLLVTFLAFISHFINLVKIVTLYFFFASRLLILL